MSSIADRALLMRIQNRDNNLDDLIDYVIRVSDVSNTVLGALDERIAPSSVAWATLTPYLRVHHRKGLFKVFFQKNKGSIDEFEAAKIFGFGYTEEALEEYLCKKLHDTAFGKGLGVYSHLIGALSEHGGPRSLEMMEVIRHELDPVIKTNKIVTDSIREGFTDDRALSVGEANIFIDNHFLGDLSQQLNSAIELLRLRGIRLPDEATSDDLPEAQQSSGRVDRVRYYMAKARELLQNHPPEALNNMRKAAEAICKDVLDAAFNAQTNKQAKPAKSFNSLEDMLSRIRKDGLVPSDVELCLSSLQSFGNHASHDQDEDPAIITAQLAESTLGHLETAYAWYQQPNSSHPK